MSLQLSHSEYEICEQLLVHLDEVKAHQILVLRFAAQLEDIAQHPQPVRQAIIVEKLLLLSQRIGELQISHDDVMRKLRSHRRSLDEVNGVRRLTLLVEDVLQSARTVHEQLCSLDRRVITSI